MIQGRVTRCPSARIARSRIRGPVLIGANAVVEDSFIGPYTAIAPGAVVLGAEIEYTMVLAGAEVRYPRYPLEASVIGERAVVAQSFGLPTGLHLELGPDARVILG
jgi:glucose-1-phosphate thymidylyltransferase